MYTPIKVEYLLFEILPGSQKQSLGTAASNSGKFRGKSQGSVQVHARVLEGDLVAIVCRLCAIVALGEAWTCWWASCELWPNVLWKDSYIVRLNIDRKLLILLTLAFTRVGGRKNV